MQTQQNFKFLGLWMVYKGFYREITNSTKPHISVIGVTGTNRVIRKINFLFKDYGDMYVSKILTKTSK